MYFITCSLLQGATDEGYRRLCGADRADCEHTRGLQGSKIQQVCTTHIHTRDCHWLTRDGILIHSTLLQPIVYLKKWKMMILSNFLTHFLLLIYLLDDAI